MVRYASSIPAPQRYLLSEAGDAIPRLYHDWGKTQEAVEWKAKLSAAKN